MGVWWRLRQWVYAHPPVAVTGAILLFLIVGFGGWQSARWLASDGTTQPTVTTLSGVKAARTVLIDNKNGRIVARTRTVTLPGQDHTVAVVKPVTRVVPTTMANGGVVTETRTAIKTVTNTQSQTVVRTRTVRQFLDRTVTVTQTRTEAGTQIPPGHVRPTVTVTVTQAAVTVTVTTSKGH
jgi:hypothetical protein